MYQCYILMLFSKIDDLLLLSLLRKRIVIATKSIVKIKMYYVFENGKRRSN